LYVQAFLERYGATASGTLVDRFHREDLVKGMGFGGVRLLFDWDRMQPKRGEWEWGRTDSILEELRERDLRAYGLLAYSPKWALPAELANLPRSESHRPVVDGSTGKGDTAFASFAAAVARRYRRQIRRWEIWNEENHPHFWFDVKRSSNRGPSAADYLSLFTLARDSILAADPRAEVAVGGLASFSGHERRVADDVFPGRLLVATPAHAFLRQLLALGLNPTVVAIHPYSVLPPGQALPGEPSAIFPDQVIDSVLWVLDRRGHTKAALWVTEWGVDAVPRLSQTSTNAWYERALTYMLCHPRIALVTIHALNDPDPDTHFGLLNNDGSTASDGQALVTFLNHWKGCANRAG